MHDLVIRGADVIDGTGPPGERVDVAVANGRIAAIGRYYGTFARLLGHYVRDQRAVSLPEAIRKMTGASAAALACATGASFAKASRRI